MWDQILFTTSVLLPQTVKVLRNSKRPRDIEDDVLPALKRRKVEQKLTKHQQRRLQWRQRRAAMLVCLLKLEMAKMRALKRLARKRPNDVMLHELIGVLSDAKIQRLHETEIDNKCFTKDDERGPQPVTAELSSVSDIEVRDEQLLKSTLDATFDHTDVKPDMLHSSPGVTKIVRLSSNEDAVAFMVESVAPTKRRGGFRKKGEKRYL